jgi:hypothetical protein
MKDSKPHDAAGNRSPKPEWVAQMGFCLGIGIAPFIAYGPAFFFMDYLESYYQHWHWALKIPTHIILIIVLFSIGAAICFGLWKAFSKWVDGR